MEKKYTNSNCAKFVRDMKKAGLNTYHYKGRFYWEGPAVNVDDIQEALSETKVKCQWDQMGRGFVVYPKESDKGIEMEKEQADKSEQNSPAGW